MRAVAKGDVYVRPTAARVLAKGLTKKDPHQVDRERFEKLTERERDVLASLTSGGDVVRSMLEAFDAEPGRTAAAHINGLTRWAQTQRTDLREQAEEFGGALILQHA